MFGCEGHHPPRDPDGLLDVVQAIAPYDVFAAIRDAEPLDEIAAYRFPALQAASLRDALADGDRELARRFFQAAAEPVNRAWQTVVGGDLALPRVKGPRPFPARVICPYSTGVLRAAERDPVVAKQFLRVASLQDPPTRLFRPATALRVLRHNLRRGPALR